MLSYYLWRDTQDALERSLTNNEGICNDERKMYYDTHLNISLTGEKYNLHGSEKPCKQDGDDPPIELKLYLVI
jgi:hypothetical protein